MDPLDRQDDVTRTDPLERELRDLLSSGRRDRDLSSSMVPLPGVYAGAARRRRRRTAIASVAGVALLAVAGTAMGLGLPGGVRERGVTQATTATQQPSDPSTGPTNKPGPPWGDSSAVAVTATSTRTFVVLGEPRGDGCTVNCQRLAQSNDGGRTFTALPMPSDIEWTKAPADVRFGSASDGWLFGSGLWSTHDGGYGWTKVPMPGSVLRLEAAAGTAWALVSVPRGDDRLQLWSSPVTSDDWAQVPTVSVTRPADLTVQADRVVVLGAQHLPLWVGGTGGFTKRPSPCPGATSVRLSAIGSIWATCGTGTAVGLHVSSDGVAWTAVRTDPGRESLPNNIVVGARSTGEALVSLGPELPLQRLDQEGTLRGVSMTPDIGLAVTYLGFTTRDVGYAIVGGVLWRTDDGGDTWQRMSLDTR